MGNAHRAFAEMAVLSHQKFCRKIIVDIQPRGQIEVTGSGNDVTWYLADIGGPPQIVNRGTGNSIRQARNRNAAP